MIVAILVRYMAAMEEEVEPSDMIKPELRYAPQCTAFSYRTIHVCNSYSVQIILCCR